ncbi:MAG: DegV family protein [Oscillospiraceae bacterium]
MLKHEGLREINKKVYRIISDSACDLPGETAAEHGVEIVSYYIAKNDKDYRKDVTELSRDELYNWMAENPGSFPRTSMPSVDDFIQAFSAAGRDGEDVVCILMSKKLTSTYQTALTARSMVLEEFPDMRIEVIDSSLATVMQGLFVLEACRLRDSGADIDWTVRELERIKTTGRIFFTIRDLEYLVHGGRLGRLTGFAGSALGIRPMIALREGELFNAGLARGRKRSLDKVENQFAEHVEKTYRSPSEYCAVVGHGRDKDEGERFCRRISARLESLGHKTAVPLMAIGNVIGAHIGPEPIGAAIISRAALG